MRKRPPVVLTNVKRLKISTNLTLAAAGGKLHRGQRKKRSTHRRGKEKQEEKTRDTRKQEVKKSKKFGRL